MRKGGIVYQTTVPFSPQQNGLVEQMNRTITERARCRLSHMQVERKRLAEAMNQLCIDHQRTMCSKQKKHHLKCVMLINRRFAFEGYWSFGVSARIDESKR